MTQTHAGPPKQAPEHPAPTIARRILIVDDNVDAATSLAMLMQLASNETHTVFDGLEAVQAAADFRPDVVLLDIGMPRMNGYETARRIREQPWGRNMTLVALTGWGPGGRQTKVEGRRVRRPSGQTGRPC